jgi:hypothetical protein
MFCGPSRDGRFSKGPSAIKGKFMSLEVHSTQHAEHVTNILKRVKTDVIRT